MQTESEPRTALALIPFARSHPIHNVRSDRMIDRTLIHHMTLLVQSCWGRKPSSLSHTQSTYIFVSDVEKALTHTHTHTHILAFTHSNPGPGYTTSLSVPCTLVCRQLLSPLSRTTRCMVISMPIITTTSDRENNARNVYRG